MTASMACASVYPAEFFGEGLAPDVRAAVDGALKEYKKLGAKLVPISLPAHRAIDSRLLHHCAGPRPRPTSRALMA
jgi:Asp-tRNA(Asn)/Glu-tRNA(Gln) amidotransferase A subunit family amidase